MPRHTAPNFANKTDHNSSQTAASTNEWNQMMTSQGEWAHLLPMISLMQNPGATSLSVMWQPNDEQWISVIVRHRHSLGHYSQYPPSHLHPNSPHWHTGWQWINNGMRMQQQHGKLISPSPLICLTRNSGAMSPTAMWGPNDDEQCSSLFYISDTTVSTLPLSSQPTSLTTILAGAYDNDRTTMWWGHGELTSPHTHLSNMGCRCHFADSNMATQQRWTFVVCHCVLVHYGKYSLYPNPITVHINPGEQRWSLSFFHTRSRGHVAVCNNIIVI